MKYIYKHNPKKDLAKVRPGLSIQIKEAIETGAIMDTGEIPQYNEIESVSSVIGRIRDNFEAVEAMNYIKANGTKQTNPTPTPSSSPEPQNE